ncbi:MULTISPECIES: hypothetical protein [Photorhabdus]|uniref:Uncharacterized protein n=1 Tax=Photorhabdus aegyptia TaxID=2805098 RepID=A0A022PPH7_9GAMM|nr:MULTISPECIES: hypothetical protein [Photorhabdus]EYU17319.1 hypothetical protein BA1DRAFT_00099 [Photorhabdus aegyptia]
MDYQNIFQLTMQEKQDLFLALNKIDYDHTGSDLYIHLVKSAMMSFLLIRVISALNKQRTSINPKEIYPLRKIIKHQYIPYGFQDASRRQGRESPGALNQIEHRVFSI